MSVDIHFFLITQEFSSPLPLPVYLGYAHCLDTYIYALESHTPTMFFETPGHPSDLLGHVYIYRTTAKLHEKLFYNESEP